MDEKETVEAEAENFAALPRARECARHSASLAAAPQT